MDEALVKYEPQPRRGETWRWVIWGVGSDKAPCHKYLERRLIGLRTKEALAVKKRQCVRLGRPATIDPKLARRVRTMRSRGMTLQAIADRLNQEGVPTPRGGALWRPASLRAVLGRR